MSRCAAGKYNKWDKVDPAELFSQAPTEKKEANPKLDMVKFLQVRLRLPGPASRHGPGTPVTQPPDQPPAFKMVWWWRILKQK